MAATERFRPGLGLGLEFSSNRVPK